MRLPTAAAFAWCLALGACLLSTDGLFEVGTDAPGGSASTTTASGGYGGVGLTTTTSGSGGTTSSSGGAGMGGFGGSGGTSSSASSSASSSSSSSSASSSSTTTSSSSSGGPTFQVPCGAITCAEGQVCCVQTSDNAQIGCMPPGGCQSGQLEVSCDGPEDCEGSEKCCGQWSAIWTDVECKATCSNYNGGERVICGNNDGNCPASHPSCIESSALPGYYWCS